MGKNISRKMRIATWSLQNQVSQNCIISPTDYTDIARIGFAPKIVKNLTKNYQKQDLSLPKLQKIRENLFQKQKYARKTSYKNN